MSRPTKSRCKVHVEAGDRDLRIARYGKGPLAHLWVSQPGDNYGLGIILDVEQADQVIDALVDLLNEIEAETSE